jgi:alpha-amylase
MRRFLGLTLLGAVSAQNLTATNTWVIFQGFDWGAQGNRGYLYTQISGMASSLASAGINAVWFPPPSQSVDAEGYLPQQWYSLVSESNLMSAIGAVHGNGMSAIADVVVNHRTAPYVDSCTGRYTSFYNPSMGNWAVTHDDENCWDRTNCGCGNYDTGDSVPYAPDLDHTNGGVQQAIKDYMNWLKSKGFDGWRLDMVKGYSASYAGSYIAASSPVFSVGEYWDSSTSAVRNWISGTGSRSQAFDFPLRYVLQNAIRYNSYSSMGWTVPGVVGQDPSHAVTFLDNHDTARNDRFGNSDQIIQGYAYILTHPGTPCVFWEDWNDGYIQGAIKKLTAARRKAYISNTTPVYIDKYQSGLYAAYVGNLAMKLGTNSWSPPDTSYVLYTSGNNYAVWVK